MRKILIDFLNRLINNNPYRPVEAEAPKFVFTLQEFLTSQTATRYGYLEQFQPPEHIVDNIELLYDRIVLPIREYLRDGTVTISSGYRCPRVNKKAKGSNKSQHMTGQAVDLKYYRDGKMDNNEIIIALIALELDYDQCIDEFGLSWVHISYDKNRNRKMTFKIT